MPYLWHTDENNAELLKVITWRLYVGQVLNLSLQAMSDIIISAVLTVLVINSPTVSLVVVSILGGLGFITYRLVRRHIDLASQAVHSVTSKAFVDATTVLRGLKDVQILGVGGKFHWTKRCSDPGSRREIPLN